MVCQIYNLSRPADLAELVFTGPQSLCLISLVATFRNLSEGNPLANLSACAAVKNQYSNFSQVEERTHHNSP